MLNPQIKTNLSFQVPCSCRIKLLALLASGNNFHVISIYYDDSEVIMQLLINTQEQSLYDPIFMRHSQKPYNLNLGGINKS